MFTIRQIDDLHARLGKAQTFWEYMLALRTIGVEKYESFLTDGHSKYFGDHGYKVVSDPVHEKLFISETSDRESFLKHLTLHEQGKTTYLEMSKGLAESGIEKWSVDMSKKTMIYYDVQGNEILVETLE